MAYRYRYAPANYFVYRYLMDKVSLDSYLKEIALDYLKKAIEYGDTAAISELKKSFMICQLFSVLLFSLHLS